MDEPPEFEPLECWTFVEVMNDIHSGKTSIGAIWRGPPGQLPMIPATLLPRARYERLLAIEAEVERLRSVIRETHDWHCNETWTKKYPSRHHTHCLLYELEPTDGR